MNYIMNFFWKSSQQTQPTVQPSSSSKTINSSNKSASSSTVATTTTTTISTTELKNDQHDKTEIVQLASNTGDYQPFFLNFNNKKRTPSINNGDNNNIEAGGLNFTLPSISAPSPRISNKLSSNPPSLLNPNISTKDLQSKLNNLKEKLNETTVSSPINNGNIFC